MSIDRNSFVIGLTGSKGSGKSSVARILVRDFVYARRPFAHPLKRMLGALGIPSEILDGDDEVKSIPLEILGWQTPRHAMQTLGTEWGRDCMGTTFWADLWKNTMPDYKRIVADDARFGTEVDTIRSLGGTIIRVVRPSISTQADLHRSETEMSDIVPDFVIMNDGDTAHLEKSVHEFMLNEFGLTPVNADVRKAAEYYATED